MRPLGRSIIVSAPSGAGKTTIVHHLLAQDDKLVFSISATSRERRSYEVHAKDYYFITADEFRDRIADGAFVEWEEVYPGRFYGTLRSELDRIWALGKHPVFDVDVVGGLHLKALFRTQALALFVAPPSMKELEERLRLRGTETPETLRERVDKAAHEMTFAPRFDAVVVNNDRDRACAEAFELVREFVKG